MCGHEKFVIKSHSLYWARGYCYPCGRKLQKTNDKKVQKGIDNQLAYEYNIKSRLTTRTTFGSIAQLGEHLPYKQRVIGSSPIVPTKLAR